MEEEDKHCLIDSASLSSSPSFTTAFKLDTAVDWNVDSNYRITTCSSSTPWYSSSSDADNELLSFHFSFQLHDALFDVVGRVGKRVAGTLSRGTQELAHAQQIVCTTVSPSSL